MLNLESWTVFLTAALALAFSPGPGMMYVLSRTISGGRSTGIISTFGTAFGGSVHVFGAAIGVSTILATSKTAFEIIKYLGVLFLIYLGIKIIYSSLKTKNIILSSSEKKQEYKSVFYQGALSEILNPKTAIFFIAFVPQFINPSSSLSPFYQFLILGFIIIIFNTIPDFLIAFFSKPIKKIWERNKNIRIYQQVISGLFLIGLGVYIAITISLPKSL